ncbi:MAG: hypothetical protein DMG70_05740 [Acidobacteria bacterium]|nr:MAG: hypothetical protein DMG49_19150 [Acidobacteriota bacterium]PYX84704.1 MAG: hypothetical protein DMG70_05740 [Acidobacteriota bacterium]
MEYKQIWAGGVIDYQSEGYSSQQCPACDYTAPLNRKTQEAFACVSPTCGFWSECRAQNQLKRFLSRPHAPSAHHAVGNRAVPPRRRNEYKGLAIFRAAIRAKPFWRRDIVR